MPDLRENRAYTRASRDPRYVEEQRQKRIEQGTREIREKFSTQFSPEYFAGIESDLMAHYKPQVEDQYAKAIVKLRNALLGAGIGNSRTAARRMRDLSDPESLTGGMREKALANIAETGIDAANKRRQQVQNAESTAVAQLQASGDLEAAAAQTANLMAINTPRDPYQPLGQVFQDVTAGIATQADLEREGRNRYNFNVLNWGNNLRRYFQNVG